ncbi:hypothetical protein BDV26DRAFT_92823 [Aspergillus bertholletiae]|uniref:Uncharacterized protein n=1 Tax=Aspergillus bertholletiae TaxID=1226010 RepID=A0A5N7BP73_9EURO|nr:hypothetical protein BDV26DRAFT_92823 [Aspergillus bertholletiae]
MGSLIWQIGVKSRSGKWVTFFAILSLGLEESIPVKSYWFLPTVRGMVTADRYRQAPYTPSNTDSDTYKSLL